VDVQRSVYWGIKYFEKGFFRGAAAAAIMPIKGTPFEQMYCDFDSKMVPIEGTEHYLRTETMIWPDDPLVRELLKRYVAGVDQETETQMKKNNIIQKRGQDVVLFGLRFMQKLLDEMKEEFPEAARQLDSLDMDLTIPGVKTG
jgi:hypothetical protein